MAPRVLAPGTMLSGRYQLTEVIGESDLSTVYAAQDVRGPAQVALKIFDVSVMSRVAALSEYQAQARQASGLGVEGVARAYDFGIDANTGLAFSTAERISWASLDRRVLSQGPLGGAELSRAFAVLARVLDAAHAAQLLHRDLKPQNVFISPDNPEWVRVTDFGVGAVRRGAPEAMGWGGPPGYTPPDAVDAASPGSPGADLFALGVIAFFALTRATPFRSLRVPTFDANQHWAELNQALSPISERAREVGVALEPAFDAWFARALALKPQDRFRSAGEMARELAAVAGSVTSRGGGGARAIPGIAAAIAQPLVFQPEPSPATLGLPHTATPAAAPPRQVDDLSATIAEDGIGFLVPPQAQPQLAPAAPPQPARARPAAPSPSSSRLPLFIGLGVLLLAGVAFGGYALLSGDEEPGASKAGPEGSAAASADAIPIAAPSAAAAPAPAPAAATSPSASAESAARVLFRCEPQTCEWIVCDGRNLTGFSTELEMAPGTHECSASRFGFGSKSLTFTATAGELSTVVFELPALPAKMGAAPAPAATTPAAKAPVAAVAPKPAAATTPPAKPAAATTAKPPALTGTGTGKAPTATTSKPATTTKKKCSPFLGCK